jgi:hypothetical protein
MPELLDLNSPLTQRTFCVAIGTIAMVSLRWPGQAVLVGPPFSPLRIDDQVEVGREQLAPAVTRVIPTAHRLDDVPFGSVATSARSATPSIRTKVARLGVKSPVSSFAS